MTTNQTNNESKTTMKTEEMPLSEQWKIYKEIELDAQAKRREVEDKIARELGKRPDYTGSANFGDLAVSYGMTETVDRDTLLQSGLSHEILGIFIRWEPKINKAAYKNAPDRVREVVERATTRKPGRPTFSIKKEGK